MLVACQKKNDNLAVQYEDVRELIYLICINDKFKITSSALSETIGFSSSSDSSESVSQGFFFFPSFPTFFFGDPLTLLVALPGADFSFLGLVSFFSGVNPSFSPSDLKIQE